MKFVSQLPEHVLNHLASAPDGPCARIQRQLAALGYISDADASHAMRTAPPPKPPTPDGPATSYGRVISVRRDVDTIVVKVGGRTRTIQTPVELRPFVKDGLAVGLEVALTGALCRVSPIETVLRDQDVLSPALVTMVQDLLADGGGFLVRSDGSVNLVITPGRAPFNAFLTVLSSSNLPLLAARVNVDV